MPNPSGFSDILKQHLSWHKAGTGCLVSIITALFVRQTVNLSALKNAFSSKAKPESIYRRMQRFFAGNLVGRTGVARFAFPLSGWQTSASPSTARHGNTANPVSTSWCWPSSGVVSGKQRIKKTVPTQAEEPSCWLSSVRPFPKSTRHADRAFIGNEWLAYLRQAGISYCIRCKVRR